MFCCRRLPQHSKWVYLNDNQCVAQMGLRELHYLLWLGQVYKTYSSSLMWYHWLLLAKSIRKVSLLCFMGFWNLNGKHFCQMLWWHIFQLDSQFVSFRRYWIWKMLCCCLGHISTASLQTESQDSSTGHYIWSLDSQLEKWLSVLLWQ